MDARGIAKATVAGHSMGGFVAQYAAIAHPERIDRLVLVSTGAGGVGLEALDWVLDQARALAHPINPVFLEHVKPEAARTPPQTWTGATLGLMMEHHRHLLPRVKVPALIL